jgi:hypothetical protein
MSEGEAGQIAPVAEAPEVKPVQAKANGKKRVKADNNGAEPEAKAKKKSNSFEFAGRVTSINIKGDGILQFVLQSKKGEKKTFGLDAGNAARFGAMANLVSASFETGAKVHVNTTPGVGSTPVAGEIEVRAKR